MREWYSAPSLALQVAPRRRGGDSTAVHVVLLLSLAHQLIGVLSTRPATVFDSRASTPASCYAGRKVRAATPDPRFQASILAQSAAPKPRGIVAGTWVPVHARVPVARLLV